MLLGISVLGELGPVNSDAQESQGGSRVDALIEPGGGGMVAVEVKTVDLLDYAQLARHAERWRIPTTVVDDADHPTAWALVRWADVWRWAREECGRTTESVSKFLLDQFTGYLERIGLAPWAGFVDDDFEFFSERTDERHAALKNRMAGRGRGCSSYSRTKMPFCSALSEWAGSGQITITSGRRPIATRMS